MIELYIREEDLLDIMREGYRRDDYFFQLGKLSQIAED